MVWWKRYEALLESKPVPAKDALLDLLAAELVELCEGFPPREDEVSFEVEQQRARFADKLARMPKIDLAMAEALAHIVTLDLEREHDAVSAWFRNREFDSTCRHPYAEDALLFLWPFVVEHLHQRKDEAQHALTRRDLVEIVARFGAKYRKRRMLLM